MPAYRYLNKAKKYQTFEAADEQAALDALPGFADADPRSGIELVDAPKTNPSPTTVPPPSPMTNPDGTVNAEDLAYGTPTDMPEPTAPGMQEAFQTGIAADVAAAKTNLDTTRIRERDEALKRADELQARLEEMHKETDPEKRKTFAQEERIIQSQLDAAETAAAALETDFNSRRKTVNELEKLLTEGNALLERSKSAPVAQQVLSKTVNRTLQNVQARAGVLQAVISGLDGNISQAHSIINNARDAVNANWRDVVAYHESYMSLVESGALRKDKILTSYASDEINLAKEKLDNTEKSADYIKELMIDPKTAQFIADAGVTLNDTVDEINEKLSEQAKREEVADMVNELTLEGYEQVAYGEGRSDVVSLEIGGKTLYFKPPPEEVKGGKDGTIPLSSEKKTKLLGVGFTPTEIDAIETSVNENGIRATLLAINDEEQRRVVAEQYDAMGILDEVEAELAPEEDTRPWWTRWFGIGA